MEISKHIDSLKQEDGRKIVQLLQALEQVQGKENANTSHTKIDRYLSYT